MREAIESAAPSGGRSVLNEHLRTCKLQSLSQIRTLPGQPKNTAQTAFGPQLSDLFDFRSAFFRLKNLLNFGSPLNFPKSQKNDLGTFLL